MSRDINKDFQSEIDKAAFLRDKIQAGGGAGPITFSGLSDTPSGYSNGQFLKSTSDGIIYTGVSFLSDVSDRPATQLVSGFLALDAQGELIWRLPTSGDITYSISGATHITGLLDTPSDYQSGKYLVSTDAGIEYRDIAELSKDIAEAQAIDFTGLSGTPSNYEQGKFLVSTSSGVAYTGITSENIEWQWYGSASNLPSAGDNHGMFAHVHDEGAAYMAHGGSWVKIYPNNGGTAGSTSFSGLSDTPSAYNSGKFLQSTADGVEWVDIPAGAGAGAGGGDPSSINNITSIRNLTSFSGELPDAIVVQLRYKVDDTKKYPLVLRLLFAEAAGIYYGNDNNAFGSHINIKFNTDATGTTQSSQISGNSTTYNLHPDDYETSLAEYVSRNDALFYGSSGGSSSSSGSSSGGFSVAEHPRIKDLSNFDGPLPDVIFEWDNAGTPEMTPIYLRHITSSQIFYSSLADAVFISFVNDSNGAPAGTDSGSISRLPHGRSLRDFIDDGDALFGGSSSNGSSSGGGDPSSCFSGVTDWSGINSISNLYTGVPENIFIEHSDGYYAAQFQNINSLGIVYSLNPTEDKYLTFDNNAQGTFKGGNYTKNGSTQTWATDSGPSLSGLISAGYSHHGGGCGGSTSTPTTFAAITDTPTGYESGHYLQSTESGVDYVSISGLAQDLTDYGFLDGVGGSGGGGGIGSKSIIKQNSRDFYTDLPDAIIAKAVTSTTDTRYIILHLQWVNPAGTTWQVVYRQEDYGDATPQTDIYIQFKLDLSGTNVTHGNSASQTHSDNDQNLKWFIENDRAIYFGGGGGSSTFKDLTDTPTGFESGKYLVSTSSGVEWTNAPAGGGAGSGVQYFTELIDTPNTYQPNRFIKVNQASDGLEYTDPLSQSTNINDGESIVSNSTEGKVKRVKAGNNISLSTSQDSLTINANIPASNTSFFGLTDTPSSVAANQFLIGDDQGNLSFSPIDLSSPVGSGFASNFNIVDTKTFYTKIPENIYATNNSASIKEVFKFHKHDAGNSIEYIGSGDKNIVFDDDISGSYSSSNLPAHLDGNNNLSLSGYIDQGRSHYEAARNTGVFNQGLRAVLSAGASEIFNDIQSPKLQNIKGDNNYFTAISYSSQVNNEAQWTVPPALTKNFLDGEVEVDIIWTSEATNGDVKWELQICPISIGVNIDQASSEPYRTIISSGPTAANNLCKGTIKFEPTVNEMQSSDFLILKVKRNALAGEDNLNGEAKLIFLSLIEEI